MVSQRRDCWIGHQAVKNLLVNELDLFNLKLAQQTPEWRSGFNVEKFLGRDKDHPPIGFETLEGPLEEQQIEIKPPLGGFVSCAKVLLFILGKPEDGNIRWISYDKVKSFVSLRQKVSLANFNLLTVSKRRFSLVGQLRVGFDA